MTFNVEYRAWFYIEIASYHMPIGKMMTASSAKKILTIRKVGA